MQITVKLFAYFRDSRFKAEVRDYPDDITVGSIVDGLEIPREEVGIIMINSKHCQFNTVPNEKDVLAIFPVIGGG